MEQQAPPHDPDCPPCTESKLLALHTSTVCLAPDEEILLDNYRNCPPDARAAIKTTSDALARVACGCKHGKAA